MARAEYKAPAEVQNKAIALLGEPLAEVSFGIRSTQEQRLRRAAQMTVLYHDHNWPLEQIAIAFAMTRERVRQVLAAHRIERRPMQGHESYKATIARKRAAKERNEAAI